MSSLHYGVRVRDLLRQSAAIRDGVVAAVRGQPIPMPIDEVNSFLIRADRPEDEVAQVNLVLTELTHARPVANHDAAEAVEIVLRTRESLTQVLAHEYGPRPRAGDRAVDAVVAELRRNLPRESSPETRRQLLLDIIQELPGLYLTELSAVYHRRGLPQVTYSTIRDDVDKLEMEEKVVTLGGPQGSNRYCFPHPSIVPRWQGYLHKAFSFEGTVAAKVTDEFEQTRAPWKDVFRVEDADQRALITVRMGAQICTGIEIKCFGVLEDSAGMGRLGLSLRQPVRNEAAAPVIDVAQIDLKNGPARVYHDDRALLEARRHIPVLNQSP